MLNEQVAGLTCSSSWWDQDLVEEKGGIRNGRLNPAGEKECRTSSDRTSYKLELRLVLSSAPVSSCSSSLLTEGDSGRLCCRRRNAGQVSEENRGSWWHQFGWVSRSLPEVRSPSVFPLWSVWLQWHCVAPAPSAAPSPDWFWKTTAENVKRRLKIILNDKDQTPKPE